MAARQKKFIEQLEAAIRRIENKTYQKKSSTPARTGCPCLDFCHCIIKSTVHHIIKWVESYFSAPACVRKEKAIPNLYHTVPIDGTKLNIDQPYNYELESKGGIYEFKWPLCDLKYRL